MALAGVVSGTVGFGNLQDVTRPQSWRGIAWESDSRENVVAVLSSLMKTETVSDPAINWFEQDLELQEVLSNGAEPTGTATSLTFKDSLGGGVNNNFRNGTLLKNDRTKEIVLISVDPTANTGAVTVTRAYQTSIVAGATTTYVNDGDNWQILGFADEDNKDAPRAISTESQRKQNFVQLMRESVDVGLMASQGEYRTGPEYPKRFRAAYNQFLRRWETTWIHGEPRSGGGSTPDVLRTTTGGLLYPIASNVKDFGGTGVSETSFDAFMAKAGRWGTRERVALCGNMAINVVNQFAKFSGGTQYMTPGKQEYGLSIQTYDHAMMNLNLLYVPRLGTSTNHQGTMIMISTAQLSRCVFRGFDFRLRKGVQNPGILGIKDELIMAAALRLGLEKHHGALFGMTTWAP